MEKSILLYVENTPTVSLIIKKTGKIGDFKKFIRDTYGNDYMITFFVNDKQKLDVFSSSQKKYDNFTFESVWNAFKDPKILLTKTKGEEEEGKEGKEEKRKNILSGMRDTDLLIMQNLKDRDLFNFCLSNKEAQNLCNNEDFWRKRYHSVYGETGITPSSFNTNKNSWKNLYLSTYFLIIETGYLDRLYGRDDFNILGNKNSKNNKMTGFPESIQVTKAVYKPRVKTISRDIRPWTIEKFEEAKEKGLYIRLFGSELVSLKDAPEIWEENDEIIFMPSLRMVGTTDDIKTFFFLNGNPIETIEAYLKQVYTPKTIQGEMKSYFDKEFATAPPLLRKRTLINTNAVCVITNIFLKSIMIFNEIATRNFYETYQDKNSRDFWVFRIDNESQIPTILNELRDLDYAELYGIPTLLGEYSSEDESDDNSENKNRTKLQRSIKEIKTDNLQIKLLHVESESG